MAWWFYNSLLTVIKSRLQGLIEETIKANLEGMEEGVSQSMEFLPIILLAVMQAERDKREDSAAAGDRGGVHPDSASFLPPPEFQIGSLNPTERPSDSEAGMGPAPPATREALRLEPFSDPTTADPARGGAVGGAVSPSIGEGDVVLALSGEPGPELRPVIGNV